MKDLFKPSRLETVNLVIVGIVSYLMSCALEGKIVWFDVVLKDNICQFILLHSPWLAILLIVWYLTNWGIIKRKNKDKIERLVYDNICKDVFNKVIKPNSTSNHLIKVSLFKVFKGDTENPYLSVVGRHQVKQPVKRCKLKFVENEGCVGVAYARGQVVQRSIEPYDQKNEEKYFKESDEVFKLSKGKARKLHDKACEFLCIPIKNTDDKVPSVISIDSTEQGTFSGEEVREIEKILDSFSVFLML